MSRKSFQRVTLSVELTLPAGVKQKEVIPFLMDGLKLVKQKELAREGGFRLGSISLEQAIIKITKRETIYTS